MIVKSIEFCARCGDAHKRLQIKKFIVPIKESNILLYDYWTTCPKTGEPIMVKVEDEDGKR